MAVLLDDGRPMRTVLRRAYRIAVGRDRFVRSSRVPTGLVGKVLAGLFAGALVFTSAWALGAAEDMRFFRIGTGGTAGTYYPIAGLIANAISNPPGSRPCEKGGSCGVPGLVAFVQSSNGSVANVDAVGAGTLESGFSQADVAFWAYTGTGIYEGEGRIDNLRVIANLYPESVHLVVRKDAGIASIADLEGKRVSLDEPGSGTLVDARIILAAFGVSEGAVEAEYIKPGAAFAKMKAGELDAFFIVAGYPTGSVAELASTFGVNLVSIEGPAAAGIRRNHAFFAEDTIPAGTYEGIGETTTLSVGAQWVVAAEIDDELVYGITRALWHPNTRKLLDSGHAKGRDIRLENALDGVAVPLHPGAAQFYTEAGLLD